MVALNRTAVASRYPIGAPRSYNLVIHADSFGDTTDSLSVDTVGATLGFHTTQNFKLFRNSTGGDRLDQIRADFEVAGAFPFKWYNGVILAGGINDVVQDRTFAQMSADMAVMADTIIANGQNNLIIYNIAPFDSDHLAYTAARHAVLVEYNTWLADTYGAYLVNIHAGLEDPANPNHLNPFYKHNNVTPPNLHPSDNGYRRIDQLLGEKLYTVTPADLTPLTGNQVVDPRDMTQWSLSNATIGGPSTKLADGTYSTQKGIVASSTASTTKVFQANVAALADSTNIKIIIKMRPGNFSWVRAAYKDNAGASAVRYVDLIDLALGAGTGNFKVKKSTYGWVEVTYEGSNGVGGGLNNISFQMATADANPSTTSDGITPDMYIDSVNMVAV